MITSFKDNYLFLSNFYLCKVVFEGVVYPSVEHAYQAAKTIDLYQRQAIWECETPGKAKRYGSKVTLREGWSQIRNPVMEFLLRQKFRIGGRLSEKLVDTYPKLLIEGNDWGDVYWGAVWNGFDWTGMNNLGKILMKIRQERLWYFSPK